MTAPVGGLGAIVGGFTGKKETTTITKDFLDHLGVIISFTDGSSFEIEFVNSTVKTSSLIARTGIDETNRLTTLLQAILKENETLNVEFSATQSSPDTDPLDEIKKLKELLDIGAITPEEFDAKKKQLLNL